MGPVMNKFIYTGLLLAVLATTGALAALSQPHLKYDPRYRQSEIEAAKESIALTLMGQLQTSMFDLMWLKTMEYLHNGIVYRMPTSSEEELGKQALDSVGTAEGLEHKEGISIVPHREEDWRGPIGEIHRRVTPYAVNHSHSDPKELIPWYKFATRVSPSQVRLYTMGAFFMSDFAHEPDEALELLEAGLESNPWSFEICAAKGRLLFDYKQDYAGAVEILARAVESGREELAYYEKNEEEFDDYQKQLLRESFLFLAKSYTELGEFEKALSVCDEGFEAVQHSHLTIQKRITTRRMNGETGESGTNDFASTESLGQLLTAIESKKPLERLLNYFRANPDIGEVIDPTSKSTALHHAARFGYPEFIEKLLEMGTDVNMRDGNGDTALKVALESGQQEAAALLESRSGIVLQGNEVIHHDDHEDDDEEHGEQQQEIADVQSSPVADAGPSPGEIEELFDGIRDGLATRLLRRLIHDSKWTSIQDASGSTVLHHASRAGNLDVLKIVLNAGGDPNVANANGETPLSWALSANQTSAAELLRKHGARE